MKREQTFLYVAWLQALVATLGSLVFSEVMHYVPCTLCWYQRIAMYPLVLILGAGLKRKDRGVMAYAAPLAVIGWVIALYHNLIYYRLLPQAIIACLSGVSCVFEYYGVIGFISIPNLSLTAFSVILVCLWMCSRQTRQDGGKK